MQKECRLCKKEFGFFTFKYICSACGHSFCNGCSNNNIVLTPEDVIEFGDVKTVKSSGTKPLRCCQTCCERVRNREKSVATAASTSQRLSIPKPGSNSFLDKYAVGKVLGEGAFAVVKEGVKKDTNAKVAIKIINRAKLSPADDKSISQEVKILGSLDHPNIVKLHEFYEEPASYYMVMECIQGGELFDRIVQKTAYSEKEARDLAFILLNTLKYCHERNIVHR
jgi:serine/threonine protein kinase